MRLNISPIISCVSNIEILQKLSSMHSQTFVKFNVKLTRCQTDLVHELLGP